MVETLETYILLDAFEDFKHLLETPISFANYLHLLRLALNHRADKFITFLCDSKYSLTEATDRVTDESNAMKLFNLMGYEYAEYFQASPTARALRISCLAKRSYPQSKSLLLASLSGDINVFKKMKSISSDDYIIYAAANDQIELVRYLHNHSPRLRITEELLVAALIHNANQVFDFLIQTDFQRGSLSISFIYSPWSSPVERLLKGCPSPTLLHVAIAAKRPAQFVGLIKKSEEFNDFLLHFAINCGEESMIDCCLTFNPDLQLGNALGEHAIALASLSEHPPKILQKLLEHLKAKLTAEQLAAFLNKPVSANQTLLNRIAYQLIKCSINSDVTTCNNLMAKAKLLMLHGASSFTLRTNPETQAQFYDFSYCADINASENTDFLYVQNCLALGQIGLNPFLTQAHFKIVSALETYFENRGKNIRVKLLIPDWTPLSKWKKFKEIMASTNSHQDASIDLQDLLECLTHLVQWSDQKTFLTSMIDESIVHSKPAEIKHLHLLIDALTCLLKLQRLDSAYLVVADDLVLRTSATETGDMTRWHNNQRLLLAKYLYAIIDQSEDLTIQDKIKKCDEAISHLNTELISLSPSVDLSQHLPQLTNQIICCAIKYNNHSALEHLVKLGQPPAKLKLLQLEFAKLHLRELVKLFNQFLVICHDSPQIFADSLSIVSQEVSDSMSLCLLLIREPQDKICNYLGSYLNHLKDANPRKLLIMAHILTYYKDAVAQPDKINVLFIKGLAELANLRSSEKTSLDVLSQQHPRDILIAIFRIRAELMKPVMTQAKINEWLDTFSTCNDEQLISYCCRNLLSINRWLSANGHTLSTSVLDDIERKCLFHLHTRNSNNEIHPTTGKRYASTDITNTQQTKSLKPGK